MELKGQSQEHPPFTLHSFCFLGVPLLRLPRRHMDQSYSQTWVRSSSPDVSEACLNPRDTAIDSAEGYTVLGDSSTLDRSPHEPMSTEWYNPLFAGVIIFAEGANLLQQPGTVRLKGRLYNDPQTWSYSFPLYLLGKRSASFPGHIGSRAQ